jgi:hypothetical protein
MQPELLQPGRSVEVPLALPRVGGDLDLRGAGHRAAGHPAGPVAAVHVKPRRAPPRGDLVAEFWAAPSLQYLPVRILIRQDAETYVDLVIDQLPKRAGRQPGADVTWPAAGPEGCSANSRRKAPRPRRQCRADCRWPAPPKAGAGRNSSMLRARSIRMASVSAAGPSSVVQQAHRPAALRRRSSAAGRPSFGDGCRRRRAAGGLACVGSMKPLGQRAQGGFGFLLDQRLQVQPAALPSTRMSMRCAAAAAAGTCASGSRPRPWPSCGKAWQVPVGG